MNCAETWNALGATVRGAQHLKSGSANQDAIAAWPPDLSGEEVVVAVADGHGSHQHFRSREGSSAAVLSAVEHSSLLLEQVGRSNAQIVRKRNNRPEIMQPDGFNAVLSGWRDRVRRDAVEHPFENWELKLLSDSERNELIKRPEIAYGTTLLVCAAAVTGAAVWQLGDGAILWVAGDGTVSRPLKQIEMIGEATHSLCEKDAGHYVQSFVSTCTDHLPTLLLLSTDGYEKSTSEFDSLGPACLEVLRTEGRDALLSTLDKQLETVSQRGNGDDITLGMVVRTNLSRVGEKR